MYETDEVKNVEKVVVYCGFFMEHWGHFLLDVTPRLWYVLEAEEYIDEYVFVGSEGENQHFQGNALEFLSLLGIGDKIRVLNEPVRYNRVIVPQLSYFANIPCGLNEYYMENYYSLKYIQIFDHVVKKALEECEKENVIAKKVFLTRSGLGLSEKKDCGIEMIDSFFGNNDYQILYPENITLKKLIYIINNCENFACIQGTTQHNLLFMKKKADVLIIERNSFFNNRQNNIIMMRGLSATFIDAHICLLPVLNNGPFAYVYNRYFCRYVQDKRMNPPDSRYMTKQYKKTTIFRYLGNWKPLNKTIWSERVKYIPDHLYNIWVSCNNDIRELYLDFQFEEYKSFEEFLDLDISRCKLKMYLVDHYLVYGKGKDENIYNEFVRVIEEGLDSGKTDFIIYPFGKEGMLCKRILNERYGINEKVILDNRVYRYNTKIRPVSDIKKFYDENTCIILTSDSVNCRNELLKYCEINLVKGPFLP